LAWRWTYFKPLPTGQLLIIGSTSLLHHLRGKDNPYSQHDKDVMLQVFSTLKFNRQT
jgi:hypothetical protein